MFKAMTAAIVLGAAVPLALPMSAWAQGETPASPDASVYFISPSDGETLSSPVTVRFGLTGMGVAPAGTEAEMTGHHHLFINVPPLGEGEAAVDAAIPADENHVHFGGGQTETTIELEPGEHTLQLVLGDANHVPHATPVTSDVITITVE